MVSQHDSPRVMWIHHMNGHDFKSLDRGYALISFTTISNFIPPSATYGLIRRGFLLVTTPIATTAFTSARNYTPLCLPTAFTGLIGENYGFCAQPPSRPRLSLALEIAHLPVCPRLSRA